MGKKSGQNTIGHTGSISVNSSIKYGSTTGNWGSSGAPEPEKGTNGCGPMPGPRAK
jgi:hypothetical protein